MSDFYLGGFADKHSFVHALDARLKILYIVVLSSLIFSLRELSVIITFTVVMLIISSAAKIQTGYVLKNLRRFYFIFLFIFLMYVVFSNNKMLEGVVVLWRFLMLILLSLVLTYTTSLPELTLAIEKLSKPLKIFGIKPRNISIMISIALRFIPILFLRFDNLREAILSRLGDFRKLKTLKALVIAILERMFASASHLTDAMMARLYNEDAESSRVMRLGRNDYVSVIFFVLFIALLMSVRNGFLV